jgi:hypothetical protein
MKDLFCLIIILAHLVSHTMAFAEIRSRILGEIVRLNSGVYAVTKYLLHSPEFGGKR